MPTGEVQDPADQYRVDQAVETEAQPEPKTVVEKVPVEGEPATLEVRETVVEEPADDNK